MDEDCRKHPALFDKRCLPGFGPFLSVRWPESQSRVPPAGGYPGWRQTRAVGRMEFDILGSGPEPPAEVVAAWAAFEARFNDVLHSCVGEVRELASRTSQRDLGAGKEGYLLAVARALDSGRMAVREIEFTDDGRAWVHLGSPEIDDYYLFPLVRLTGLRVVGSEFVE